MYHVGIHICIPIYRRVVVVCGYQRQKNCVSLRLSNFLLPKVPHYIIFLVCFISRFPSLSVFLIFWSRPLIPSSCVGMCENVWQEIKWVSFVLSHTNSNDDLSHLERTKKSCFLFHSTNSFVSISSLSLYRSR